MVCKKHHSLNFTTMKEPIDYYKDGFDYAMNLVLDMIRAKMLNGDRIYSFDKLEEAIINLKMKKDEENN